MEVWIWVLFASGALLAVLCVSYGTHRKRLDQTHHAFRDVNARLMVSDIRINPRRGMLAVADKAPSSVYRGEVCFFDSIEHRDMFEANHHRPVATDSVLVANHEQYGRRIQRQDTR